jgi:hypothetical protein
MDEINRKEKAVATGQLSVEEAARWALDRFWSASDSGAPDEIHRGVLV